MILLRPTIVESGRLLWQVVAVYNGQERVISPPLSRQMAAKVASWASTKPPSAFFEKAGV